MTYASEVLADNPDVWLRLDDTTGVGGTAVDSSGQGRNGGYSSGATAYTQNQGGLLLGGSPGASVLMFGGRVSVLHGAWQNAALDVTIELLIRWTGNPASPATQWVAAKDGAGSPGDLSWRLDTASGKLEAIVYAAGVVKSVQSTTTMIAGVTYHGLMSHDRSNLRVFLKALDGVTVATTTLENTVAAVGNRTLTSVQDVTIGLSPPNGFPLNAARVQEFAMYPAALSTARIAAHYNAANGTLVPPPVAGVPTNKYRRHLALIGR